MKLDHQNWIIAEKTWKISQSMVPPGLRSEILTQTAWKADFGEAPEGQDIRFAKVGGIEVILLLEMMILTAILGGLWKLPATTTSSEIWQELEYRRIESTRTARHAADGFGFWGTLAYKL